MQGLCVRKSTRLCMRTAERLVRERDIGDRHSGDIGASFPEMEKLRIAPVTPQWHETFTFFMKEIGEYNRNLKCLGKFSLCYATPHCWSWSPESDDVSLPAYDLLILNDVGPPMHAALNAYGRYIFQDKDGEDDPLIYWKPQRYGATRINVCHLREEFADACPRFEEALRVDEGIDADIDLLDTNVIMHEREARHIPRCAKRVCCLADCCPMLEEFE